jgi:hypothetical protein
VIYYVHEINPPRIFMHEKLPIQIRFELDELAAIDSYRRAQPNPPTRPQAIREILHHALTERSATAEAEARA